MNFDAHIQVGSYNKNRAIAAFWSQFELLVEAINDMDMDSKERIRDLTHAKS